MTPTTTAPPPARPPGYHLARFLDALCGACAGAHRPAAARLYAAALSGGWGRHGRLSGAAAELAWLRDDWSPLVTLELGDCPCHRLWRAALEYVDSLRGGMAAQRRAWGRLKLAADGYAAARGRGECGGQD